jgi:RNA-splicing ligase RtcB
MRRPDLYEERARELCLAAGIDPDSRLGEGRGRPAWVDYRQPARDEHIAREQLALAALPTQNPNAPDPIVIGNHDEGTIGQMRNCMSYGDAVAGMICADGHLGYAQPVGGVIAYRDQMRKGATPAFPGQRGFVDGSMGDDAVILEGAASERSAELLYSTVHGAGRLFGRMEAKRRFQRAEMDNWLRARGVMLMGTDLDESPMAYRRLPDVLAEHAGTVRILHTMRPFAVVMAGPGEFDPFKD